MVVAEHLHFGRAAERLRLAQPQISRRIAQLEESLNSQLFERSSRTVKLTDVGEAFLPEAIGVLKAAETARQRAMERARGRHGVLKVSANDAAMIGDATPIIRSFHTRYPEVYLAFQSEGMTSLDRLELMNTGKTDIVFTHPPPPRQTMDFDAVQIVNDPLIAVLPASHRLAALGTIDVAELANEPWVIHPRENDPPIYDRIIGLCEASGFTPRVVHETAHMLTRLGMVAGGFGVNLVHSAWRNIPYPGVAYVSIEPTDYVAVSCFWRRDNTNPLVTKMVDIVRAHAV